uniref:Uncharacterized protein n=1 Tax=Araneus ventricosus TaxID=182803 RepID=A0A4Y2USL7_ARAVE|nr:hypothetical protein AVEN_258898-1 [Araneus ventricosus]
MHKVKRSISLVSAFIIKSNQRRPASVPLSGQFGQRISFATRFQNTRVVQKQSSQPWGCCQEAGPCEALITTCLSLTKGANLAKRLAKKDSGQNACKQVQNSSVEILTFNLHQSFDLESLRIRPSFSSFSPLKPSRPAHLRRGRKVKTQ